MLAGRKMLTGAVRTKVELNASNLFLCKRFPRLTARRFYAFWGRMEMGNQSPCSRGLCFNCENCLSMLEIKRSSSIHLHRGAAMKTVELSFLVTNREKKSDSCGLKHISLVVPCTKVFD